MDREKQIEEMAEAIFHNCNCGLFFSEAEKQRKIKEQEADEIRVKYVIAGVVLFIVLLIATILCVQNC